MEVNVATVEGEKEMLDPNVVSNSVSQSCRCNELEERSRKAEMRCVELEIELQKKKEHCEALEAIVNALEGEEFAVEDELKVFRMLSKGFKRHGEVGGEKEGETKAIVDLTNDDVEDAWPMIENKVLKCEKKRAESEVEVWKGKYKKWKSRALQFRMRGSSYYHAENGKKQENKPTSNEGNLHLDTNFELRQNQEEVVDLRNKEIGGIQSADTPSLGIFHKSPILDVLPHRKVRKQLTFETEESPSKKIATSTLGAKSASVSVIDIIDSDEEPNITQNPEPSKQASERISVSTCFAAEVRKNSNDSCAQNNEESLNFSEDLLVFASPKRKRTCNVVTSESEDDDDNIPNCNQGAHTDQVRPDLSSSLSATISEDDNVTDRVMLTRRVLRLRKCASKSQDDKISKHVQNIPTNDDDDDDIPICKLKRMHIWEVHTDQVRPDLSSSLPAAISKDDNAADSVRPRRRLLPLRKCISKSQDGKIALCRPQKTKYQQSIPTNDDANDNESAEDLSHSYSEEENMSDFIVDDSDVSNFEETSSQSQDVSNCDVDSDPCNAQVVQDSNMDSDSQDVSDGDIDFGKILSKIQRNKSNKMKWEFEGDMLAAFGKDPELCMKAVCALYRQQTSEEQMSKGALFYNQRGFSKFDAHRGSTLAEFLTDGDPLGGLKKCVEELQEYDPEAVELCRSLAIHYSKQLYEIYKNKEDAFFP